MTVMSRIAGVGEQDNWLDSRTFGSRMTGGIGFESLTRGNLIAGFPNLRFENDGWGQYCESFTQSYSISWIPSPSD